MPQLRFTRDKRGYETTAVVDSASRRRGRGQRLLYWFRTPPGVRVGRAAIDEQAMRLLEQHNPDVQFDWGRLLKDAPQDHGPRRERDREFRDRDRRDRREPRPAGRPRPLDTTAAAVPPSPPPGTHETNAEIADERADAHADRLLKEVQAEEARPESVAVRHGEPLAADHAEYLAYAEAAATDPSSLVPDPESAIGNPAFPVANRESPIATSESPAVVRLGVEGVTRLRLRYTQLVVRLGEKPIEDELRAELNARLERLNPDAWQTADEVAAALEQYEAVFESLRAHIGHQPRRKL